MLSNEFTHIDLENQQEKVMDMTKILFYDQGDDTMRRRIVSEEEAK